MHLRSGRIVATAQPDESASNHPFSNDSSSLRPSLDLYHGLETNLQRIHSDSSLSSGAMSQYKEAEDQRVNCPSNSASLIDRFSSFIGLGNPSATEEALNEQEVNSGMEGEPTLQAPHLGIPISDPPEPPVAPLTVNGMTPDKVQQIQDTMQLARQLEAEATLRGHQRLIERTAKANSSSEKGKSKLEEHPPVDTRTFETDNWKYSVSTQTLFDKLTQ